jgi:hypothetical protein
MNNPKTKEETYFNSLPKNIRLEYFKTYNFEGLEETPECMLFRVAVLLLDIVIDDTIMTAIVDEFIKCMANERRFIDTFHSYRGVLSVHSHGRENEEIDRLIRFCDLMNAKLTDDYKERYKGEIQIFVSACDNHYKDVRLQTVLRRLQYQEKASHPSAYTSSPSIRDRSRSPSRSPSPSPSPSHSHSHSHSHSKKSIQKKPLSVVRRQNKETCKYDHRGCIKHNDPEHMARFDHPSLSKGRKLGGKPQTIIKKRYTRRRRQTCKRSSRRRCRY